MNEYIEKDKALAETWKEPRYTDAMNALTEIRDRIRSLPPADVQLVVHGEWIKIDHNTYRCSECGKTIITNCDYIREHKFCFGCGAKMDGKGADNVLDQ